MASMQKRGENSWFFVINVGYRADGTRDRRTKTVKVEDPAILKSPRKLKEYLNDELTRFKMEVESGEYINPEKMTFSSFVEIWTKKFVQKNLEETTAYNYSFQVNKRMIPYFGEMQLDKIKTLHLTDYMDKLAETVGESSQVYNFRILRSIFSKAVAWKVLKTNPMDGVDKPKEQPKEMDYYNEKEVAELLNALDDEEPSFRIQVLLALTTGMRRGELLGLEWKHIDLEQGIIDVKQTIPMYKDGEPVIKGPKRSSSVRKIVIPSSVVEELKVYQKHMARERTNSQAPWEGGDHYFLFAGETGRPLYPKTLGDRWRAFHQKNPDLKYIRFHDLRHTSATLLISQGVHAKIISSRLGHSKIGTTMNVYGHVIESADRAAAETFNNLLTPKQKNIKAKS